MDTQINARIRACLYGLAAGDLNGGPTCMAILLGESLAELGRFDPEDIFRRYHEWWRNGAFDTGNVFAQVMELVDDGHTRKDAVILADEMLNGRTGGINPAHRVAPLACAPFISDFDLPKIAREEAMLTHCNPLAGEAAAIQANILRSLIRDDPWEKAKSKAWEQVKFQKSAEALISSSLHFPERGYAPEIIANAIQFIGNASNFTSALEPAFTHAGRANYSPVLTGAMAGALFCTTDEELPLCNHGSEKIVKMNEMIIRLQTAPWEFHFECSSGEVWQSTSHLKSLKEFHKIQEEYQKVWDKKYPDADQNRSHRELSSLIAKYLSGNKNHIKNMLPSNPGLCARIEALQHDFFRAILKSRNTNS